MNESKRIVLAGFMVAALLLLWPFYLQLIGLGPESAPSNPSLKISSPPLDVGAVPVDSGDTNGVGALVPININVDDVKFSVVTDKIDLTLTNSGGGSLETYNIIDSGDDFYKFLGGYDDNDTFFADIPVSLILNNKEGCAPCLLLNNSSDKDVFLSVPFNVVSPHILNGEQFKVFGNDSLTVTMEYENDAFLIKKLTTFYGNKFIINHKYFIDYKTVSGNNFNVAWLGGMRYTEKNRFEESTYAEAYLAQNKDISSLSISPSESFAPIRDNYSGGVDWVAIRNKYFINSMVSKNALSGFLGGETLELPSNYLMPEYSMGLGFGSLNQFEITQFFGPLDVDLISDSGSYLDRVMNFGWLPIQPFSRSVLWLLKKLHLLGVNYGFILIFFAFLIRFITGPLTKKSFESSQNMQTIQPKIKKIQAKYKGDPAKLNRETMNLYKESGVNPLGGCLPMLVQMPLLFALFIVFRSTIEFRGAPFMLWINNLSQPDTIFNLPFYVPIYGDQIAFLPIILGFSMFLSQKLSMATMDSQQKPIMYIMSVFFFLIFNSFPSGLNLYYVVYNLLNYQQQKSLKKG